MYISGGVTSSFCTYNPFLFFWIMYIARAHRSCFCLSTLVFVYPNNVPIVILTNYFTHSPLVKYTSSMGRLLWGDICPMSSYSISTAEGPKVGGAKGKAFASSSSEANGITLSLLIFFTMGKSWSLPGKSRTCACQVAVRLEMLFGFSSSMLRTSANSLGFPSMMDEDQGTAPNRL
jgi:hypothetical protein